MLLVQLKVSGYKVSEINYHNRIFKALDNSDNGEVGDDTRFHYRQEGDVVWATYGGGSIKFGTLTAKMLENGDLDLRYGHLNLEGEMMTGKCLSKPEILSDGRLKMHETWQWTSGDESSGTSLLIEVVDEEQA